MRYDDAVARLRRDWSALGLAGPDVLVPILIETGERRTIPPPPEDGLRPASVLVLILPGDDGEARILLTERVDRGGHHSGEVSFPGGSAEPDDADAIATA